MLQIGIMLNQSARESVAERMREALQRHEVARKSTIDAAVVLHEARLRWGSRAIQEVQSLLANAQGAPADLTQAATRLDAGYREFQARAAAGLAVELAVGAQGGWPTTTTLSALSTTFVGEVIRSGPLSSGGSVAAQAARAWLEREGRSTGRSRSGVLPTLAAVGGFRGRQGLFGQGGRKLAGQLEQVTERLVGDVESDLDGLRRALNEQRRISELTRSHGTVVVQEARRLRGTACTDSALHTPEQQLGLRRLLRAMGALHGALTRQLECG